jgi:hypothetical protein
MPKFCFDLHHSAGAVLDDEGYDAVRVPPNDWRSNCWGKPFMDGAQSDPTMKRIAAVAHRCL